jgi:L-arabinose isomerase
MKIYENYEIWFLTGSQYLYGEETLKQVAANAKVIVHGLNEASEIPVKIIYKPVVTTPEEILQIGKEAAYTSKCIGIIAWMHTFSPSKMWIKGLSSNQKPILHLHTQFNRDIPFANIDMDFMNLNQSAHGDREFAHILTKMNITRKTVVGHWQSISVRHKIGDWTRLAIGKSVLQSTKIARFGDNMREVAVTDGDKVAAEMKFGFSVNYFGVADLVKTISAQSESDVKKLVEEYENTYIMDPQLKSDGKYRQSILEAAKIELGLTEFLETGGFGGYTNTFEDLSGMKQLPGIATQRLMQKGYGFGAEGDWKTAALLRALKVMTADLSGGNSFMEDYTYHFEPGNEMVLGSHMLEICPSITTEKVSCEIHPLGIGGKEDPVRLVFDVDNGPALNISLVDLGHRFRLIINKVEGIKVEHTFPKLPTARALWKPHPDMETGLEAWLMAGGAHHTVYSQNISVAMMEDFGEMFGVETVIIDENTDIRDLKNTLRTNEVFFRS